MKHFKASYPNGQQEQTLTLLANTFNGSNSLPATNLKHREIKLTDENKKVYRWTIIKVPKTLNVGLRRHHARQMTGWTFTDHEGYSRFSEGNFETLQNRIKEVAANYGLSTIIDGMPKAPDNPCAKSESVELHAETMEILGLIPSGRNILQ